MTEKTANAFKQQRSVKNKKLVKLLNSASEATMIDYRRRSDMQAAAFRIAGDLWLEIKEADEKLKTVRPKSLWRDFNLWLLVVGFGLYYWLADGKFPSLNFGTWMVLAALYEYGRRAFEESSLKSRCATLRRQQDHFKFSWMASGASERDFWECRKEALADAANTDKWVEDKDGGLQLAAAAARLQAQRENRWLNIQYSMLQHAGVAWSPGWPYDLDDVSVSEIQAENDEINS